MKVEKRLQEIIQKASICHARVENSRSVSFKRSAK